ncbi:MAG: putative bifunctional diguanylate cyclase/phosphodiesterase [Faecousia sp.]
MPRKRILIAEDNDLNREMLGEILSEEYEVLEAENGQQAQSVLKRNKDSVSLILLDIMMPVMDGFAFLDWMKQDPELSLIPVIVLTQSGHEDDEVAALAHGATDFVPKPYRPQVILHRVASLIKLRETAAMVNQFQYDRLTGVYSKEFFCQKVREELIENPEREYSIVCTNIENFKLFNDIFGVQEGDRLLKEVAATAKKMVGSTGFCGRFGADHFLVLQWRERERLDRQGFGKCHGEISPLLKSVVMRWGIYEITDPTVPVEQMCDRALLAASSIKGQYNQFFAVYDDALRHKLLREQAITEAMGTALREGQFAVYLQPKCTMADNRIAGAEALVRWFHPQWGFLSPGEFIPLFEKNGFIHLLDHYIWEQVCALLQAWQQEGYPLLPVSVNISRADLYHVNLVDDLTALTQKYGVDPKYLHLEITESAYVENTGAIIKTLEQLRELGFPIEMDDFGSGYSSLNMLSQMRPDVLKLDVKFVQNEASKPEDQSILNDIIVMAHRMHLQVVAEGVETKVQAERLREVACDYGQGYFFAKPMPTAEFEKLWFGQLSPTPDR